jgi:hypothetical protein
LFQCFLSFPPYFFLYLILFPIALRVSRSSSYYVPSQVLFLRCYPPCNIPSFISLDISDLRALMSLANQSKRVPSSRQSPCYKTSSVQSTVSMLQRQALLFYTNSYVSTHKLSLPIRCTVSIIQCSYVFRPHDMAIFRELQTS